MRFSFRFLSLSAAAVLAAAPSPLTAAPLTQATVTTVVKDVKVLSPGKAGKAAAVNEIVRREQAVRTGGSSRAELTFTDSTLLRMGANSLFNFEEGTRNVNLESGTLLFQVPKTAGGAQLRTAAVTAAITGTTGLYHYTAPSAREPGVVKLILLEGTARIAGKKIRGGQMFTALVNRKLELYDVKVHTIDIKQIMETSPLIAGAFAPLTSQKLIAKVLNRQSHPEYAGAGNPTEQSTAVDTMHDRIVRVNTLPQPRPPVAAAPPGTPGRRTPPPTNPGAVDSVDSICRHNPLDPRCAGGAVYNRR